MRLLDFGVVEISKEEAENVEGGGLFAIILGAVFAVATIADAI